MKTVAFTNRDGILIKRERVNCKYLWLNKCYVDRIPKEVENFTKLVEISLSVNELKELPDEFGKLTQLSILKLEYCEFDKFPTPVVNITGLTILLICSNHLTELPDSIGNLVNLNVLDLRGNNIVKLPDSIGELTQLTKLQLRSNSLTELPISIGRLRRLRSLELKHNKLIKFPSTIGNLGSLRYLYFETRWLKSLTLSFLNIKNAIFQYSVGGNNYVQSYSGQELISSLSKYTKIANYCDYSGKEYPRANSVIVKLHTKSYQ